MAKKPSPPADWPEPKWTGNAQLLEGYIAAAISLIDDAPYSLVELGERVVLMHENENRYWVKVMQISGVE